MQKVRRKSRTFGVHYIDLRPNSEYIEYIGIKGTQAKEAASKSWLYKFTEDSMHPYHYDYKINGMKVTKKEYKKYVDALKKEKAITASKLKWRQ